MPFPKNLLTDLTGGDEDRAQAAVVKLAASDASVLPALLDLAHSNVTDHRWWAICALGQSPHGLTEHLLPFLDDPSPEVRQAAILGLHSRADESAVPALVTALSDEDSMAANLAANALVKVGRASVPALIEIMESASQGARILALRALAEIKDQRAIPVMMKMMQADSALLQHWANEGLERLSLDMVYIKP